jgi:hypothetical protein
VHRYNPSSHEHEEWTKVKHVPTSRVEAYFEGCWRSVVRWRPASSVTTATSSGGSTPPAAAAAASAKGKKGASGDDDDKWTTLIDLTPLRAVPKAVRPTSKQHPSESRRLWDSVTSGLFRKEYGEATRAKHVIEQRQRDEAAERKRRGIEYVLPPSLQHHFYLSALVLMMINSGLVKVCAEVL